ADGMAATLQLADRDFDGLAFVNLVDFDMLYGHRRDIPGYAAAIAAFDAWLPRFLEKMRPEDLLMITADHGCDPGYTKTTDHTREYVPYLVYGAPAKQGINLGTRYCFGTIANTICDYLGVPACLAGCGVWNEIAK
ncbi:MAG: phosphopentomutase, partial [Gemmiger sp.]|nr:phosphopentomutase [Gemmiger sp.]